MDRQNFLAQSDMRKELLLPIHVQLALLDRDCCQPSFVGCLSIWAIWAGPNPHPLSNKSRVLLDVQLNWESQGSDSWNLRDGEGTGTRCPEHDPHIPDLLQRTIYLTFHLSCPRWPLSLPIYALTHSQKFPASMQPSDYTTLPGDIRKWRDSDMSFAQTITLPSLFKMCLPTLMQPDWL